MTKKDGKFTEIIKKLPTIITFTSSKVYFGKDALTKSFDNVSNSIYAFLTLIGRNFNDKVVQEHAKHVTYDIIKIDRDKMTDIPKFPLVNEDIGIPICFRNTINNNGNNNNQKNNNMSNSIHVYTVIEIVSQYLEYLLTLIEEKLKCPPAHVAISVPNSFGQKQRLVTCVFLLFFYFCFFLFCLFVFFCSTGLVFVFIVFFFCFVLLVVFFLLLLLLSW